MLHSDCWSNGTWLALQTENYVSWTLLGCSAELIACHHRIIGCEPEDSYAHVRTQLCYAIQPAFEQGTRRALSSVMRRIALYPERLGWQCMILQFLGTACYRLADHVMVTQATFKNSQRCTAHARLYMPLNNSHVSSVPDSKFAYSQHSVASTGLPSVCSGLEASCYAHCVYTHMPSVFRYMSRIGACGPQCGDQICS